MRANIKFDHDLSLQVMSNNQNVQNPFYKPNAAILSISKDAPQWFKDGVNEQITHGKTIQEAIKKMSQSPFFEPDWIFPH